MSEQTFRAVVAAVLIGTFVLAVLATAILLDPFDPGPGPSPIASPESTRPRSPAATPVRGPAFATPIVVGVGPIDRGSSSALTLELEFVELRPEAIPDGPGTLRIEITDHAGADSAVAFTGTPSVVAPGSLGATATLLTDHTLVVSIEAADPLNTESISITGLGIRAAANAALGEVIARASEFTGSLSMAWASATLASPGTVVDRP